MPDSKFFNSVLNVDVTVEGTAPFRKSADGLHGTLRLIDANDQEAKVYVATEAEPGYQAATQETAPKVFANTKEGNAALDDIIEQAEADAGA